MLPLEGEAIEIQLVPEGSEADRKSRPPGGIRKDGGKTKVRGWTVGTEGDDARWAVGMMGIVGTLNFWASTRVCIPRGMIGTRIA